MRKEERERHWRLLGGNRRSLTRRETMPNFIWNWVSLILYFTLVKSVGLSMLKAIKQMRRFTVLFTRIIPLESRLR